MEFLATTNRGLEAVAADEIRELVAADASRRYPGAVAFSSDERAVYRLNYLARSLHRVLLVAVDGRFDDLDDLAALAGDLSVERFLTPDLSFAVRSQRHGEHPFTSVDVADRVGQAVVDACRTSTGQRPPVDLDDPDVVLRAIVRHDRFTLAVDTTGHSLHRRPYRVCEHDAPLRPTVAHGLLRLADWDPMGESLLDPTCGGGAVPVEAALWARDDPPSPDRGYALETLPCFDAGDLDALRATHAEREAVPAIEGSDRRETWVDCAGDNAAAAGVAEDLTLRVADATERPLDADVVVADLPFGVRTSEDLPALYDALSANLRAGDWSRFVGLTTRPDLLDLGVDPAETHTVHRGRIEAAAVVARR